MDARHEEAHDKIEKLFMDYPDVFGPGTVEDCPTDRPGDWILVIDWHDLEDKNASFYAYQLERSCHKHHAIGLLNEGLNMINYPDTD